jgi:hypothetical protein
MAEGDLCAYLYYFSAQRRVTFDRLSGQGGRSKFCGRSDGACGRDGSVVYFHFQLPSPTIWLFPCPVPPSSLFTQRVRRPTTTTAFADA